MRKHTPTVAACVLTSVVGGILTAIAFTFDASKASNTLSSAVDVAVGPGTIAYLLISGGETGSTPFAEAVAPFVAAVANMICYPLILLAIIRIYRKLRVRV
jgi:small neutral amino acid transporter SnatA (MarC family)